MRVYLPRFNTDPFVDIAVDEFKDLAAQDRFRKHCLVDDSENADLVLFTQCHMLDWRLESIRSHPVAKAQWSKLMVYDERDRPWRSFPGVYVSMPRSSFDARFQRSWGYFRIPEVPAMPDGADDPELLYSFVGSMSHPCRRPLFELHDRDAVVEEAQNFMFWDTSSPDFEARRDRFKTVLLRSRFVLCPRGRGTSSLRLYQALAAGRVPVIISDEWVPPRGPNWELMSLRWPEGRTKGLIDMLEERDAEWPAMSSAARTAHCDFFGSDASFHRIVECCADLQRSGCTQRPGRSSFRIRSLIAAAEDRFPTRGFLLR